MSTWSGLWNNEYGIAYSSLYKGSIVDNPTARAYGKMMSMPKRALNAVGAAIGALMSGVGTSATTTIGGQITAKQGLTNDLGGKVTTTSVTRARVTTITDFAEICNITTKSFIRRKSRITYPTDASGNGGGGKVGH